MDTGSRVSRAQAFLQANMSGALGDRPLRGDGGPESIPVAEYPRFGRRYSPNPDAPNVRREGNNLIEVTQTPDGRVMETIYPNRTPAEFGKWARPNDEDWSSEEFLKEYEEKCRRVHEEMQARMMQQYQMDMDRYEMFLAEYEAEAAVICPQCQESVRSQRHALGCILPTRNPNDTFVFVGPPRKPSPPKLEPFTFRKPSIDRDPMVRFLN